ncbi:unnamed protein product [Arctogadus glacialis]
MVALDVLRQPAEEEPNQTPPAPLRATEDWGRYECVVQLKGIEDISTPLDPALIRTNGGKSPILVFILAGVAVVAVVAAAAAAVVGVFVYQKRNDSDKRHKPVGSDTSSENTEGQNPAAEAQPLTTVQS